MWKNLKINAQNIEFADYKTTLIKMPNNSDYAGYRFWHPSKLIRDAGGKGYFKSMGYTEDFEFKLKKYGRGQHNSKKVLHEVTVDYTKMEEAFESANKSIKASIES